MLLFLVATAHAMGGGAGGQQGGGFDYSFLVPLLLVVAVIYFLMIRPQQRAEKRRKEMLASVKKGYRVITAGGIRGTVAKVYEKEKIVVVTIAKGVEVEVALAKIEAAAPPGEDLAVAGAQPDKSAGAGGDKAGPRRPRRK